ncbi:hypothetical protein D3C87_1405760 [compost metagenome]
MASLTKPLNLPPSSPNRLAMVRGLPCLTRLRDLFLRLSTRMPSPLLTHSERTGLPVPYRSNLTAPSATKVWLFLLRNLAALLPVTSILPLPFRSRTRGSPRLQPWAAALLMTVSQAARKAALLTVRLPLAYSLLWMAAACRGQPRLAVE